MSLPKDSFVLHWHDTERPVVGEGLSRTSNKAARLWRVDVKFTQGPAMKTTIKATSKTEAIKFTKNRHPTASTITVLGRA